jgi:DNA-binding response OmpR family regulator
MRRMTATSNKILVIDDERPIRKLLRIGVSTQGYKVIEASNGGDTLHLLSQNPAAKIRTDLSGTIIQLPVISSRQVQTESGL